MLPVGTPYCAMALFYCCLSAPSLVGNVTCHEINYYVLSQVFRPCRISGFTPQGIDLPFNFSGDNVHCKSVFRQKITIFREVLRQGILISFNVRQNNVEFNFFSAKNYLQTMSYLIRSLFNEPVF